MRTETHKKKHGNDFACYDIFHHHTRQTPFRAISAYVSIYFPVTDAQTGILQV
jgi:hypothetical protein